MKALLAAAILSAAGGAAWFAFEVWRTARLMESVLEPGPRAKRRGRAK